MLHIEMSTIYKGPSHILLRIALMSSFCMMKRCCNIVPRDIVPRKNYNYPWTKYTLLSPWNNVSLEQCSLEQCLLEQCCNAFRQVLTGLDLETFDFHGLGGGLGNETLEILPNIFFSTKRFFGPKQLCCDLIVISLFFSLVAQEPRYWHFLRVTMVHTPITDLRRTKGHVWASWW